MRKYYIFIGLLCLFCFGLAAGVIMKTGTPAKQEAIQMDQTRMSDFSLITSATNRYFMSHGKLPGSLQELKSIDNYLSITDPKTHTNYSYKITATDSYQLCATFSADSKDDPSSSPYVDTFDTDTNTQHKKGYDCIGYTIPASYRPLTKPAPTTNIKPAAPTSILN